jgi:hypothetical protein
VLFRYVDAAGQVTRDSNPNGSVANVAGLCNEARNVVGLMPHPERACELAINGADGLVMLQSAVQWFTRRRRPRWPCAAPAASAHDASTFLRRGPRAPRRHARGVRQDRLDARPAADPHRARHLLGDVVRALQLQELAGAPQDAADHRAPRAAGPGENAGAVDIGDGLAAVFKIESHNHPSFIEPYQGAATGVGGIIRDIFTMGARPIALLNSLRFGSLDNPLVRRNMAGVVAGIGGYGNSIGIPTVGGEIAFDESYTGNPLVNVFCLGSRRPTRSSRAWPPGVGNSVFYVGSKTGATASTAPRWPRRSSTTSRPRSGPRCRWAIRSWRSSCSRPVSR